MKKKKWGQKIYIEWIDACEQAGWQTLDKMLEIPDEVMCKTNAFYIGEKDGFLIVAHTIGKTEKNDMTGKLMIPKKWIMKVR